MLPYPHVVGGDVIGPRLDPVGSAAVEPDGRDCPEVEPDGPVRPLVEPEGPGDPLVEPEGCGYPVNPDG